MKAGTQRPNFQSRLPFAASGARLVSELLPCAGRLRSSREPSTRGCLRVLTASLLSRPRSQLLLQGQLLPEVGKPKSEEREVWKHQIRLAGLLSGPQLPRALGLLHFLHVGPEHQDGPRRAWQPSALWLISILTATWSFKVPESGCAWCPRKGADCTPPRCFLPLHIPPALQSHPKEML